MLTAPGGRSTTMPATRTTRCTSSRCRTSPSTSPWSRCCGRRTSSRSPRVSAPSRGSPTEPAVLITLTDGFLCGSLPPLVTPFGAARASRQAPRRVTGGGAGAAGPGNTRTGMDELPSGRRTRTVEPNRMPGTHRGRPAAGPRGIGPGLSPATPAARPTTTAAARARRPGRPGPRPSAPRAGTCRPARAPARGGCPARPRSRCRRARGARP